MSENLTDEQDEQLGGVISGLTDIGVELPEGHETWTLAEWEMWLDEVSSSMHGAISGTSLAYEFQGALDIVQELVIEVAG